MRTQKRHGLRPLAAAISLAATCGLLYAPAQAALVSTAGYGFSDSASITGTHSGAAGAGSSTGTLAGSSTIARFDPALGVLTGAQISLNSHRSTSLAVTGTAQNTAAPGSQNADASATLGAATLSAPGASASFTALSRTQTCTTSHNGNNCNGHSSTVNSTTDATLDIAAGSLNAYVAGAPGALSVTRSAALSATATRNSFSSATATLDAAWHGNLHVQYDYLAHAAPSFSPSSAQSTQNIDFGTWFVGSTPSAAAFLLANRQMTPNAANQVGLDLDQVSGSGNTAAFTTGLPAGFANLAAGQGLAQTAGLNTAAAGNFAASYQLAFSDADVGASASRHSAGDHPADYTLNLNLSGRVVEHANGSFSANAAQTTLNIDFGTLLLGEAAAGQSFDIYNLLSGSPAAALRLFDTTWSGDATHFSVCSPVFATLAAGSGQTCSAGFDTSQLGHFVASYRFDIGDDASGIGGDAQYSSLYLNLSGEVVAPLEAAFNAAHVAEPGTLALLGLPALAFALRRARRG
ncbi:MAG: choice-of-anchor D domain-containing protein [Rhodocyclaceae bacterium]|nr:choice-of-anchor D domain-containing protein [Rhodocyclaceae bacterium]